MLRRILGSKGHVVETKEYNLFSKVVKLSRARSQKAVVTWGFSSFNFKWK